MDSNKEALNFALKFLNDAQDILQQKKTGGKKMKKSKKQKGGTKDDEALPKSLSKKNQEEAMEVQGMLQSNPQLQEQFEIEILETSREFTVEPDINEQFADHIKSVITQINNGQKPILELTPQELQMLALFVHFKNMGPQMEAASKITSDKIDQIETINQSEITEEPPTYAHNQLITLEEELLVQMPNQPVSLKQTEQQSLVLKWILNDTNAETISLLDLYNNERETVDIMEDLLGDTVKYFKESLGQLALLMSILNEYKNLLVDYAKNLKTNNPMAYTIITGIYATISFKIFFMYQLFVIMLSTKIGRLAMIYIFIDLYRQNNSAAVFIANILLKLLGKLDERIGASEFAGMCLITIQDYLYDILNGFIQSAAFSNIMSSLLRTAFASPEAMTGFVRALAPELSQEVLTRILPQITTATTEAAAAATSEALVAYQSNAATSQITSALTRVGAQAAITAVASYFGAPAPANLLTNGGRRKSMIFKGKTNRLKKTKLTKKRVKRRMSRKTKKIHRRK
jgi:hypothetical protein